MRSCIIALLLAVCGPNALFTQAKNASVPLRNEIKLLVDSIAKEDMLTGPFVGYSGKKSEQWDRVNRLAEAATGKELKALTDHESVAVRCCSFRALAVRLSGDVFQIALKHFNDTAILTTLNGCIGHSIMAGDYFIEAARPFSGQQSLIVDSMLLYGKNIHLHARYTLLSEMRPEAAKYERIKEIAAMEKEPVAAVALARFKNNDDTALIANLFKNENEEDYAAWCAGIFPAPSFYPYLVNMFEKELSKEWYDHSKLQKLYYALAKYPTPQTYKLFERSMMATNKCCYRKLCDYLLEAINASPDELFEPLRAKIMADGF